MTTVEIVPALRAHALAISRTLRDGDLEELAVAKVTPAKAVWRSFRHSLYARTMLVNSAPAAMWGVGGTALSHIGETWLLTSELLSQVPLKAVREGRMEVEAMRRIFGPLEGLVYCKHHLALRFLDLIGFEIEPGDPFCRYWRN